MERLPKLNILYYNARSLVINLDSLKANTCTLYKPDIICIVETWLGDYIMDSEVLIPGYYQGRINSPKVYKLFNKAALEAGVEASSPTSETSLRVAVRLFPQLIPGDNAYHVLFQGQLSYPR